MKKTATILTTLTLLALVAATPAAAREANNAPGSTGTRLEPSQPISVVKATGVIRQGINVLPYVNYRIYDTRTGRHYALVSSGYPALLHRHVGERVTVYGTRVLRVPKDLGPPLLDVFRVVPLSKSSAV